MNGPKKVVGMSRSGFCEYGPASSHDYCVKETCECDCHEEETDVVPG